MRKRGSVFRWFFGIVLSVLLGWVGAARKQVLVGRHQKQQSLTLGVGVFRQFLAGLFTVGFLLSTLVGQASAQGPFYWINPVGGEQFVEGSAIPISWSGGDPSWSVNISLIDVALWQGVSGGISGAISNDGSEIWNISPNQLPNNIARDYQLYIQDVNQSLWRYSATFTIIPAPPEIELGGPVQIDLPVLLPNLTITKKALSQQCEAGDSCPFEIQIINSGGPYTGPLAFEDYLGGAIPPDMLLDPLVLPANSLPSSWYPPSVTCLLQSSGQMPAECSVLPATNGVDTMPANSSMTFTSNIFIPSDFDDDSITNCVTLLIEKKTGIAEDCVSVPVTPSPRAVEHFQCYGIEEEKFDDRNVKLVDQFGATENIVLRPITLCAPVDKNGEGMVNDTDHLVCYALEEQHSVEKLVRIENQFGIQHMRVLDTRVLCVPSIKTVIEDEEPTDVDFGIKKTLFKFGSSSGVYTIEVDNHGGNLVPPSTLTVIDYVPAGMTVLFVPSSDWQCPTGQINGPANPSCTWIGSFPILSGPMPPIQLQAIATDGGEMRNCAEVVVGGSAQTDIHSEDDMHGNCKEDDDEIDIGIKKSKKLISAGGVAGQASYFEFNLRVDNHGDDFETTPNNIVVTDTIPAGLTYLKKSSGGGWSCVPQGPVPGPVTVNCTWFGQGLISSGPMTPIVLLTEITDDLDTENCVEVAISDASSTPLDIHLVDNKDCIPVVAPAPIDGEQIIDIGIKKTKKFIFEGGAAAPASHVEFTLQVDNHGDIFKTTPHTVVVTDTIPAGLTYLGKSSGGGWSCVPPLPATVPVSGPVTVTCTWFGQGLISPGTMTPIVLLAEITDKLDTENCVEVAISDASSTPLDIHLVDNKDCVPVVAEAPSEDEQEIDLGVTKRLLNGPLQIGDMAKFAIEVTNLGNQINTPPAFTIQLTDVLPAGFVFASITGPNWNCVNTPPVECTWVGITPIPTGSMGTLILHADVKFGDGGKQCAQVEIIGQTDVNPSNNEVCITVIVDQTPAIKVDLGISKQLLNGPLQVGDVAVFEISVINNGDPVNPGTNTITVPDVLPPGFVFIGNSGPWNCAPVGGITFTCEYTGVDIMQPGDVLTFTVSAEVQSGTGGRQCAGVQIAGLTDLNASNDQTCITVAVNPVQKVDLGIRKRLLNGPLQVGDIAEFQIDVFNYGDPIPSPPPFIIVINDTLPPGFQFISDNTAQWHCGMISGQLQCTWLGASIASGALPSFVLKVKVTGHMGGLQCAKVRIVGIIGQTDLNPENDEACIKVAVSQTAAKSSFACVDGLRSASSKLNLRQAPSGSARVLMKIPQGTALVVLQRKAEWSQVQTVTGDAREQVGWVATRFTRKVSEPAQCGQTDPQNNLRIVLPKNAGSTTPKVDSIDDALDILNCITGLTTC